jgi:Ca2+-binding RTX toxin-like protein
MTLSLPDRRARTFAVLAVAAALGLGMTARASAQPAPVAPKAAFAPASGVLTVTGNDADNIIIVSRDPAGNILVNRGSVSRGGGTTTVSNTTLIHILCRGGNNQISLDESNGPLPAARIEGGDGDDVLTGGQGADEIDGGQGNDTLLGRAGNDVLTGGPGDDILTGGQGNDIMRGGAGDDRLIWNPGDASDIVDGGGGDDTLEFNGGNVSEVITIAANGKTVHLERNVGTVSMDITTVEHLFVNAVGGDDTITAGDGLAGLVQIIVSGGTGNDKITGGDGDDVLLGGDGDDIISGGAGDDIIVGGAGNDTLDGGPGNNFVIQE